VDLQEPHSGMASHAPIDESPESPQTIAFVVMRCG